MRMPQSRFERAPTLPFERAPIVRRLLVTLLLLTAAACSATRAVAPPPTPLRVGTSGDYPPFSLRAADGGYSGFDVTVARAYAADRGRPLVLVPFRWPELATRIADGSFDVAMSGVTVRGDRLLVGTMTAAVARADAVLLVRHDDRRRRGFDHETGRIAVNRGGHLERVARARLPHATLVTVDDNRALPALLRDRRVDAVVTDTLEAATYEAGAFTIATRLAHDRKAYWVAPDASALAADLDAWLLARERDGTLARWRAEQLRGAEVPPLAPDLARVVDLAARRLLLMPLVAAAKRAGGLPIVDPAREAQVVSQAAARATAAGLDGDAAGRLARAQIAAARAIQAAAVPAAASEPPTLAAIRTGIDALDGALVRALVDTRAAGAVPERAPIATALRADADLPGFDAAHADAIAEALVAVLHGER